MRSEHVGDDYIRLIVPPVVSPNAYLGLVDSRSRELLQLLYFAQGQLGKQLQKPDDISVVCIAPELSCAEILFNRARFSWAMEVEPFLLKRKRIMQEYKIV